MDAGNSMVNQEDIDTFYLLYAGSLVFFMQSGFAMLCAGSVRAKNVKNIMLKNILDACAGALGFWIVGYTVAYAPSGKNRTSFIGRTDYFFIAELPRGYSYIGWFFQFTFAATAATIVAGTIAERCKMAAYACYSIFLTAWVYPVVVHSIWSDEGFLSAANTHGDQLQGIGAIDFAGSGVVHMTGGCTALVAAVILGPRIGRFKDADGNNLEVPTIFPAHSTALQVLGTFILWFGWYGFNPGSTLRISGGLGEVAALCAVTTTLSAACGCISALITNILLTWYYDGEAIYDLTMAMNGTLSGLVAITAGCSVVQPWAGVVIGLISGPIYLFTSKLLVKCHIDDVVDAIPVHFFNGIWGVFAVGAFADPKLVKMSYGISGEGGFLYGDSKIVGNQVTEILFIVAWVFIMTIPFFFILKLLGLLRVDPLEEEVGMDISHHGGFAYDIARPMREDIERLKIERMNVSRSGNSNE